MNIVKPKKSLGQHFLKDQNIARKIVESLQLNDAGSVLEIGPGMGVLTKFLLQNEDIDLRVVEIDHESVEYLVENSGITPDRVVEGDFLQISLDFIPQLRFAVIGNFPYNISSQIFFKILQNRERVTQVVGMVQREVALRISAMPGSKVYGILSVLLQTFYQIEYLFTVNETVFHPPPKVKSAVIRLSRNGREQLGCNDELFFRVVKTAFNQRRKMLGNALKPLGVKVPAEFSSQRAEQLSVDQFIQLTRNIEGQK